MMCEPVDVILRFQLSFAYVAHCCRVLLLIHFVHELHGGSPSVDELTEVELLALCFCVECGLVRFKVHQFGGLSCSSYFLQDGLSQ